ncbi:TMEM175 family protein [Humibacter soli]
MPVGAVVALMRPSTGSRLSAYTDAVFAVIITIMVLELRPPVTPTFTALLTLWPTIISYLVSYVFIAIIWINHHYLMGYVKAPSLRLMWINFGHLFFVSLLPFATAWIAESKLAAVPVFVYTALFVVTDGVYNLFEREILRTSTEFGPDEYRHARRRSLIALLLFAIAAGLAILQPWVGFGFVCLALLLHLRPDAAPWNRHRDGEGHPPDRVLGD